LVSSWPITLALISSSFSFSLRSSPSWKLYMILYASPYILSFSTFYFFLLIYLKSDLNLDFKASMRCPRSSSSSSFLSKSAFDFYAKVLDLSLFPSMANGSYSFIKSCFLSWWLNALTSYSISSEPMVLSLSD